MTQGNQQGLPKTPPFRQGKHRQNTSNLDQMRKNVNALIGGVEPPFQLGIKSLTSEEREPVSATDKIQQFKVVSLANDYIVANEFSGTTAGEASVKIAKPFLLRRTGQNGVARNGITPTYTNAFTRSATDGTDTETQVIVPSYQAGDIIYATAPAGGTGVKDNAQDPQDVLWQDLNTEGRAWARQSAG